MYELNQSAACGEVMDETIPVHVIHDKVARPEQQIRTQLRIEMPRAPEFKRQGIIRLIDAATFRISPRATPYWLSSAPVRCLSVRTVSWPSDSRVARMDSRVWGMKAGTVVNAAPAPVTGM